MKKLVLLVLLVILLVGCSGELEEAQKDSNEVFYTEDKLEKLNKGIQQLLDNVDGLLFEIQTEGENYKDCLEVMTSLGKHVHPLYKEGHKKLSVTCDHLSLAGNNFDLWKAAGKGEYYTKGVQYLNNAKEAYYD